MCVCVLGTGKETEVSETSHMPVKLIHYALVTNFASSETFIHKLQALGLSLKDRKQRIIEACNSSQTVP